MTNMNICYCRAIQDLANFTPFPDEWSVEDKVLFEQAFQVGFTVHRFERNKLLSFSVSWKIFPPNQTNVAG